MPEPESVDAIRAAVEAILPPTDGAPGAADLGVPEHVVRQAEIFLPGFTDLAAALLNAYAASVDPARTFAELPEDQRRGVLAEMSREEAQDLRETLAAIAVFALGASFSEITGRDPETGDVTPPEEWRRAGYAGSSHGYPDYRSDR